MENKKIALRIKGNFSFGFGQSETSGTSESKDSPEERKKAKKAKKGKKDKKKLLNNKVDGDDKESDIDVGDKDKYSTKDTEEINKEVP